MRKLIAKVKARRAFIKSTNEWTEARLAECRAQQVESRKRIERIKQEEQDAILAIQAELKASLASR